MGQKLSLIHILLVEAVRAGLGNEDGRARGSFVSVFDKLTLEEIRPLLPAIYQAVVESAPSGIMFSYEVRNEGLRLLAKHNVQEGMQAGADYLRETWDQWGSGRRTPTILKHLVTYGGNATVITPQLEEIAQLMEAADAKRRQRSRTHTHLKVREAIDQINNSGKKPEMIQIEIPRVGSR